MIHEKTLTKRMREFVVFCQEWHTQKDIADQFGIQTTSVAALMRTLCNRGYIERAKGVPPRYRTYAEMLNLNAPRYHDPFNLTLNAHRV